jgi:DNA-binding SARP family transcriptional activator/Tol biopolymer transport system component
MLVLELLGTLSLRDEARPVPVTAQQKRSLGLLAVLALAGRQGLQRERIETYLWPESSSPNAQHSLEQTVYAVRRALGSDFILSTGRELRLNPDLVQVDVWGFDEAIRAHQWRAATDYYKGPLLDGFHVAGNRDLESWIDARRTRLRREYQTAIELLAEIAAEAGDLSQSVTWSRRLVSSDPLSPGATKQLMRALGAAGDRAGAVTQARLYQQLVRQELEIEPDSEIADLAAALSRSAITEGGPPAAARVAPDDPVAFADGTANPPHDLLVMHHATVSTPMATRDGSRERTSLYVVILIAMLMTGAAVWGWARPATSNRVVRYTLPVDSTEAIVAAAPWSGRLALSPDGSQLAYIGGSGSQLLIRPLNQLHATAIPGTEGVTTPFFSPNGRQIGFLEEEKIWIASISGGAPVVVTDTLTGVAGASWGPDDFIYVDGSGQTALLRVEAKAGSVPHWFTVLDTATGEFDHSWPDVLPNGKGVLFTVARHQRSGAKAAVSYAIAVADIPSGKHREIVDGAVYARYASSGHLVYVTANKTLMVAPFDQSSMTVTGEPTALSAGMRLGLLGSADLAISGAGRLVYATGSGGGEQELVWVARDGKAESVDPEWTGGYLGFPAISPDGTQLAVARVAHSDSSRSIGIWIKRLDRGPSIKLTLEGRGSFGPAWTPDGRSVTFAATSALGIFELWTKRADGGAEGVMQLHEGRSLFNARWSPDGKWLLFHTDPASPGKGDILGIRLGIDTAPVPVVATPFTEMSPALSPNGRWLAYTSNESGAYEIYAIPFPPTGTAKWAISAGGGTEPLWSHSGRELFYRDASGNLVAVEVNTNPTFSLGRATKLFPAAGFTKLRSTPQYAVGRDDQRFLMIRPMVNGPADKLIFVENWFEEVRRESHR